MSNLRLGAVMGVTAAVLGATLFLETNTDAVASVRESVGATEYTITDATRVVAGITSSGEEIQAMMAVTGERGLAAHLPTPSAGWEVQQNLSVDSAFLTEFGRSFSGGLRPAATAIWPAGTLVVNDQGRAVVDQGLEAFIYGGERDTAHALYENGIGRLLVSIERLPENVIGAVRKNDEIAQEQLGRDHFEVQGQKFYVLNDENAPQLLIRGYLGGNTVVDIRGSGYVGEVEELIERIDVSALTVS